MNQRNDKKVKREHINVRNSSSKELTLTLEPWGDQHKIPAGGKFEISASGPNEGHLLEFEIADNNFTIYGWPSSVISILQDGKKLAGSGLPAPSAPPRKHKDQ